MRNQLQYSPGDKDNQQARQEEENKTGEDVIISLPRTERPQGPFEHSGETSGQTKEEEIEKEEAGDE